MLREVRMRMKMIRTVMNHVELGPRVAAAAAAVAAAAAAELPTVTVRTMRQLPV